MATRKPSRCPATRAHIDFVPNAPQQPQQSATAYDVPLLEQPYGTVNAHVVLPSWLAHVYANANPYSILVGVFAVAASLVLLALVTSTATELATRALLAVCGAFLLLASVLAVHVSLRQNVTTGWLFALVEMAKNLQNSPPVNAVLRVSPGFEFMDVRGLGCFLFVRPCYVALQHIIFNDMIPGKMTLIAIMGIPGVGKTCFLYYVLCDLIRLRKLVVFEDFEGLMFMVTTAGKVFRGKRGDAVFEQPLRDKSAFYLFNCGGLRGALTPLIKGVHAVSIVASSSCEAHTKEFGKAGASNLFMPMWGLDELQLCRQLCLIDVTANEVAKRFGTHGGVARPAFFTGNPLTLENDIEQALAKFRGKPQDVFGFFGEHDTLQASHRLLHYEVAANFMSYKVILASDYIGDRMCDANLQAVVDHIRLLQDNEDHGLRGKLFERFAHRVLPHGNTADYPMMMLPATGGRRSAVHQLTSTVPVLINSIYDIASKDDNVYLLPTISNFPVVDALVKPSLGYQMTVSNTHNIAVENLKQIVGVLACGQFDLVWVVPPDVHFRCPESPDCDGFVLRQFILKLPLRVPLVLRRTTLTKQ